LYQNSDLDLQTVFLLDKVQKREVISKEAALRLRKQRLVEGRYPHLIVSYKVANIVGTETEYLKDKGLSNEKYKQIIINALERLGESRVSKLTEILEGALPAYLDNRQKAKKVSYILKLMRQRGLVEVHGAGHLARWKLIK
jgi:ATP-dependent DNA helicase RecG